MGYYDQTNLPFYHGLAKTFPICDRWFSSVLGPTYPNRRYLQAATSAGIVATDTAEVLATPTAPNGTIWERLDAHGISWVDYAIDIWEVLLWPTSDPAAFLAHTAPQPQALPRLPRRLPGRHAAAGEHHRARGARPVRRGVARRAER